MVALPSDSHVHSEWSWDARAVGSMEQSCARAIETGLPAIAFTEHLDHTMWRIELEGPYAMDHLTAIAGPDGMLTPPAFDAAGYLEAIARCSGQSRRTPPPSRAASAAVLLTEMTSSDVPTAAGISKPRASTRAGTMTNPPPMPMWLAGCPGLGRPLRAGARLRGGAGAALPWRRPASGPRTG